jgi:hypothetical protein
MRSFVLLAGCCGLAACAAYRTENEPLQAHAGIQRQIQDYYDANAVETDWNCPEVQMDNINASKVVSETPSQLKIAVSYHFSSFDDARRAGINECKGFETRYFTFDKAADGRLTLSSMSGERRQP